MNADTLKGQWHQVKGSLKTQWGKLTDDDINQIEGQSEKLIGKLQERYGYARDRAQQEFDNFKSAAADFDAHTDESVTKH
jgi:uncharacterized protein YjbJ (UPF0337 family)